MPFREIHGSRAPLFKRSNALALKEALITIMSLEIWQIPNATNKLQPETTRE